MGQGAGPNARSLHVRSEWILAKITRCSKIHDHFS